MRVIGISGIQGNTAVQHDALTPKLRIGILLAVIEVDAMSYFMTNGLLCYFIPLGLRECGIGIFIFDDIGMNIITVEIPLMLDI